MEKQKQKCIFCNHIIVNLKRHQQSEKCKKIQEELKTKKICEFCNSKVVNLSQHYTSEKCKQKQKELSMKEKIISLENKNDKSKNIKITYNKLIDYLKLKIDRFSNIDNVIMKHFSDMDDNDILKGPEYWISCIIDILKDNKYLKNDKIGYYVSYNGECYYKDDNDQIKIDKDFIKLTSIFGNLLLDLLEIILKNSNKLITKLKNDMVIYEQEEQKLIEKKEKQEEEDSDEEEDYDDKYKKLRKKIESINLKLLKKKSIRDKAKSYKKHTQNPFMENKQNFISQIRINKDSISYHYYAINNY